MMVTRRAAIIGLGALIGGAWYVDGKQPVKVNLEQAGVSTPNLWTQQYSNRFVSKLEFEQTGQLKITLDDSHGMEGLAVYHVSDDEYERNPIVHYGMGLNSKQLPRYSGTLSINLASALSKSGHSFPSNIFKLIGFTGGAFNWDKGGEVQFKVPSELMPKNRVTLEPSTEMITPTETRENGVDI